MKLHTDFSPVLQLAIHAATYNRAVEYVLAAHGTTEANVREALFQCRDSCEALLQLIFEFCGQHIAQPRRALYKKVSGLKPGQHTAAGFLTGVEAVQAAEQAKTADRLRLHQRSHFQSFGLMQDAGRGINKGRGRGRGKGLSRGGNRSVTRHLPVRPGTGTKTAALPAVTPAAKTADSAGQGSKQPAQPSTPSRTPSKGAGGRGRGNK